MTGTEQAVAEVDEGFRAEGAQDTLGVRRLRRWQRAHEVRHHALVRLWRSCQELLEHLQCVRAVPPSPCLHRGRAQLGILAWVVRDALGVRVVGGQLCSS